MKIVLLDAIENESGVSQVVRITLKQNGHDIAWFKLNEKNIRPCVSCGACGHKSPGKCVINDDMQSILHAIAPCDALVMLTPIRFGGYSSTLKKAVDRFMPLGLPLYMVKKGHLLHPMRYQKKFLLGIGILEDKLLDQEENFKKLVANNALNLQYQHKTLVINELDAGEILVQDIENAFKEVNHR